MTTFNDLLGTSPDASAATVKQRYKLLSSRVHPDKGGSQALMHLVRHSYENAAKGKGQNLLTIPASASVREGGTFERELNQLKKEKEELSALNQLLKGQLAQAKKGSASREGPIKNTELLRKISLLEGEIVLLKDERSRLMPQKEAAIAEQKKLAAELRRVLSENEVLETELDRTSGVKSPGLMPWANKFWLPAVIVSLCLAVVIIGARQVSWPDFTTWFEDASIEPKTPTVKVVYIENETDDKQENVLEPVDAQKEAVRNEPMPFLQLTSKPGVWSLARFTVSEAPYIAIRSDKGSYIVTDCSGSFNLYLNKPFKPLRVPANLIYLHQNQHFHVYDIPYGQGSSSDSWMQSRKLQINDEYFTSNEFKTSAMALLEKCSKRS
ncbi:J domain-containing protein [Enterovibrio norvegicus]|uniref:J domain-containing protein n=1 Tax=Enterovibrio norvegicus TaxID=188144 RepID=UPI001F53DB71|nr:J domain-containing protein [Enterovibrio norvegicus]